jgi:hypothetical protein
MYPVLPHCLPFFTCAVLQQHTQFYLRGTIRAGPETGHAVVLVCGSPCLLVFVSDSILWGCGLLSSSPALGGTAWHGWHSTWQATAFFVYTPGVAVLRFPAMAMAELPSHSERVQTLCWYATQHACTHMLPCVRTGHICCLVSAWQYHRRPAVCCEEAHDERAL